MVQETKFEIITLSETQFINEKHSLEYVNIPSYKYTSRAGKKVLLLEYVLKTASTTRNDIVLTD